MPDRMQHFSKEELEKIHSSNSQMAEFYGVLGRSGGNLTDAHIPDIQAGIESALCLMNAMRSGTSFLLRPG